MSNISSFFGLNIALKSLQAHQRSLDVTAHNVANQNTTGYTRQEAALVAARGLEIGTGALAGGGGALLGGGVDVSSYLRARDAFTDLQWRVQSTVSSYTDTTEGTLASAQVTLQEPGKTGIASMLQDFWDSWQALANNPEPTSSAREALVISGRALGDAVNALDSHVAKVQSNAAGEYGALTGANGDVQTLATQIARLNAQIGKETIAGRQPNDLLDARDKAVDDLSKLGQVTVTGLPNGAVQVAFGGVTTPLLVDDATVDPSGLATMTAPGGRLGALRELSSTTGPLQSYRNALDGFVGSLVSTVNTAYQGTFFSGTTAGAFAVAPAIVASPGSVTANSTGSAGGNDIALAVAALRAGTADKAYGNFVLKIGADVRQAQRTNAAAEAVMTTISDKRDSVSGVSLDEEVTNMIRFQRGYQASSRTMSTLDEMLDTLINRTGRVGL